MEKASQFLTTVVLALVEDKEAVSVESKTDERGVLLTLKVAQPDMGRIIGKNGSMAQSIRTILKAIGAQESVSVSMRVIDPLETEQASSAA